MHESKKEKFQKFDALNIYPLLDYPILGNEFIYIIGNAITALHHICDYIPL